MTSEFDIVRRNPRIVFLDGTMARVYRQGIPTGNPTKISMTLLPYAWSVRMANLDKELTKLNESSPMLAASNYMVYQGKYDPDCIIKLSENPEFPLWLAVCNIKGESVNFGSPKLIPLITMKNKINALEILNKGLNAEIDKLRERNNKLVLLAHKQLREDKELAGSSGIERLLPSDMEGISLTAKSEG